MRVCGVPARLAPSGNGGNGGDGGGVCVVVNATSAACLRTWRWSHEITRISGYLFALFFPARAPCI